jgi:arylsulfatase A-like enzyme
VISEARLEPDYVGAIRTPTWKYIEDGDTAELYDLAADPRETTDCKDEEPAVADVFERRLAAHRRRYSGTHRTDEALSSDELDDQLRSLGYLE